MNEKPILFSGPMVTAILNSDKTQTRRVLKKQPLDILPMNDGSGWITLETKKPKAAGKLVRCRYGSVGDQLWVRERMRVIDLDYAPRSIRVRYEADGTESTWIRYPERLKGTPAVGKCLSYGGYREASRINLEITNVRVERLQDISGYDAGAEGVYHVLEHGGPKIAKAICEGVSVCPEGVFETLWDVINGKKHPWASNPWVWVLEFRRI